MFDGTRPSHSVGPVPSFFGRPIRGATCFASAAVSPSAQGWRQLRPAGVPGPSEGAPTTPSEVQNFESYPGLHPAVVEIGSNHGGQSPGLIFMDSHFGPGQQGPIILDGDGHLVWFKDVSARRRFPRVQP